MYIYIYICLYLQWDDIHVSCNIHEMNHNIRALVFIYRYGGFHKWGYPKWMVYSSNEHGGFRGTSLRPKAIDDGEWIRGIIPIYGLI